MAVEKTLTHRRVFNLTLAEPLLSHNPYSPGTYFTKFEAAFGSPSPSYCARAG